MYNIYIHTHKHIHTHKCTYMTVMGHEALVEALLSISRSSSGEWKQGARTLAILARFCDSESSMKLLRMGALKPVLNLAKVYLCSFLLCTGNADGGGLCLFVCTCKCMYVCIYIHTHTYTRTNTYIMPALELQREALFVHTCTHLHVHSWSLQSC
jgi:hypothetical protein